MTALPTLIGLDYETYGEVDLPTYGLANYLDDPKFRVLVASVVYRDAAFACVTETFDLGTASSDEERDQILTRLTQLLEGASTIVAHNASFERAVTKKLLPSLNRPDHVFTDSAVVARALGAGSRLEAAAPQLLNTNKMEDGSRLIKKFSMPQPDGRVLVDEIDSWKVEDWTDWETFKEYCDLDAELSLRIVESWGSLIHPREWGFEVITQQMNDRGWFVDLPVVRRMQEQYEHNREMALKHFRAAHDPKGKLNFRSTPQLRAWCKARGVNAKSFDELNTAKLLARVRQRLNTLYATDPADRRIAPLQEVEVMLVTKQTLGGSSLSKLATIQNLVSADGRLRNQYLHVGAGQSFRTSGRGAQLQNLKRLSDPGDVTSDDLSSWDNERLASNLRQVFRAEHPDGMLLVGDFKSVESRGLAYLAGAEWKVDAFREGKDMYKVQAASMFGVPYESVTPDQRQTGKVGELSCGYGAGAGAVARFAEKMGSPMSEAEAGKLVSDWRDANPEVVKFWADLDQMLRDVVEGGVARARMHAGPRECQLTITIEQEETPDSLSLQNPQAQTISLSVMDSTNRLFLRRWFQGAFLDGRDICYHKPSELKSGKLWLDTWHKDGQSGRYKLYGGKLAGILTQSFCRELFFRSLSWLDHELERVANAKIIGQFHDEIVVEWTPPTAVVDVSGGGLRLSWRQVQQIMKDAMSDPGPILDFPLEAEVGAAHRYVK